MKMKETKEEKYFQPFKTFRYSLIQESGQPPRSGPGIARNSTWKTVVSVDTTLVEDHGKIFPVLCAPSCAHQTHFKSRQ